MEDAKTVWVGNIADQVTEELLYELFLQAGPLERVKIPTDREGRKSNFGFITFKHEVSVPYTVQLLNGVKLFERNLNIKPRNGGANNRQNAVHSPMQSPMQRSLSYPNQGYNSPHHQNEHTRFDNRDMGQSHISFEDLLRMGHMMNVNYGQTDNNFGNDFGNNHGHNSHHNERGHFRDRERDRRDFDHPRNDNDRDNRDRHHDYSSNRNNRRNHEKKNNFDRNGGKRNNHRY